MKAAGVTLNEKCIFSVSSMKFTAHIIMKDGIQIDPEKVKAIIHLPQPKDVSKLQRLLDIIDYVGKFA